MFKNQYKLMYSNIKPSNGLLEKTINMNKQKNKTKYLLNKLLPAMACLAVAITIVIYPVINNSVAVDPNPNPININNTILTNLQAGNHSEIVELTNGKLVFNTSDLDIGSRLKLDLNDDYKKELSYSEVISYLGYNVKPKHIPQDLIDTNENKKYSIYYNEDGSILYDKFTFVYQAESDENYNPLLRSILLEVSKANNTTDLFYLLPEDEKTSTINGVDVIVGYREMDYGPYDKNHKPAGYYDMYVAKFQYKGLYYRVIADNLSQEEFVNILTSIIEDTNNISN